jgi:hypothetical protein
MNSGWGSVALRPHRPGLGRGGGRGINTKVPETPPPCGGGGGQRDRETAGRQRLGESAAEGETAPAMAIEREDRRSETQRGWVVVDGGGGGPLAQASHDL